MENLLQKNLALLEARLQVSPMPIPLELEQIRFPLGLLQVKTYNYQADKIRKIYFMKMSVWFPALDYLGMGIYPAADVDLPIFYFDLSCTGKKTIAYINSVPLLPDNDYRQKYLEPLAPIRETYRHLPTQETREWMTPYVTPQTIYSVTERKHLEDFEKCGQDYLACYLDQVTRCEKVSDANRVSQIEAAQRQYRNLMLENDVTARMLGRLIGKKKARRMFWEILS